MSAIADELLSELRGVGGSLTEKLARLGLRTKQDLLFHLPSRYEDRTRVLPIGSAAPYQSCQIEAQVLGASIAFGRRRSLQVRVQDDSGVLTLRFFYFNGAQKAAFAAGRRVRCFGEVRPGASGLEMYHPDYLFPEDTAAPLEDALTPIYPITEGLTQKRLRQLIAGVLNDLSEDQLPDLVPSSYRWTLGGTGLLAALREVHQPPVANAGWVGPSQDARNTLAYEELLAHQVSLAQLRELARTEPAPAIRLNPDLERQLLAILPYQATGAQRRVAGEIYADLAQPVPMMRLLQGDVGSGKTLVAALAALQVIGSGCQAALMVPTEILAEQHQRNFSEWFEKIGRRVVMLTGKTKGRAREATLALIREGNADLVIGTHALFQDGVEFKRLGLVIIDEQHRFGVGQRLALNAKAGQSAAAPRAHQLLMTATPIPRTLAMSHYSNLDLSVIDELPPGRKEINTVLVSRDRRGEVIDSIRNACREGRQVYWVCTLIEESENFDLQAAELAEAELRISLPGVQVGLVHGRMKPGAKSAVMAAFRQGEIQLLVATTVIEVGVDVPNASLMIIENAERLGLAQLHQLRGRVGRGSTASHCVLLYGAPLSNYGRQRLQAMRDSSDGFVLAEIDLHMRGPGELLGARQTGEAGYRIADLLRDSELLELAKNHARDILLEHPALAIQLVERWIPRVEKFASA